MVLHQRTPRVACSLNETRRYHKLELLCLIQGVDRDFPPQREEKALLASGIDSALSNRGRKVIGATTGRRLTSPALRPSQGDRNDTHSVVSGHEPSRLISRSYLKAEPSSFNLAEIL
jgi:hypothetical protein